MALSGDGKRVAFLGGSESGERVVALGERVLYDPAGTVEWPLAMTDDASIVAYQVTEARGKAYVVVAGRRGATFDAVGTPRLSADGAVVAYRAQRGGSHLVVVGEREGPTYEFVKDPALTPDGKSVAYAAARGGRWFLVVDGSEQLLDAEPVDVFLGPDRRFVGWTYLERTAGGGSRARVVVGGRRGPAFDLVGRPTFSPDGSTFAYFAETEGRPYVVMGERAVEAHGRLSDPVFSRDGTRVGYGARIGRELWWRELRCP